MHVWHGPHKFQSYFSCPNSLHRTDHPIALRLFNPPNQTLFPYYATSFPLVHSRSLLPFDVSRLFHYPVEANSSKLKTQSPRSNNRKLLISFTKRLTVTRRNWRAHRRNTTTRSASWHTIPAGRYKLPLEPHASGASTHPLLLDFLTPCFPLQFRIHRDSSTGPR